MRAPKLNDKEKSLAKKRPDLALKFYIDRMGYMSNGQRKVKIWQAKKKIESFLKKNGIESPWRPTIEVKIKKNKKRGDIYYGIIPKNVRKLPPKK